MGLRIQGCRRCQWVRASRTVNSLIITNIWLHRRLDNKRANRYRLKRGEGVRSVVKVVILRLVSVRIKVDD
jgi:hypothetical protein